MMNCWPDGMGLVCRNPDYSTVIWNSQFVSIMLFFLGVAVGIWIYWFIGEFFKTNRIIKIKQKR
jgi:hypothetical protein